MDTSDADPNNWTFEVVSLTGLDGVSYPEDPEPEYVAINENNICVITLQENNGLVLVDLTTLSVVTSYSAGSPVVTGVDVVEDGIIDQTATIAVPREPDAVTWISTEYFASKSEKD
jgi:hypothetical protein